MSDCPIVGGYKITGNIGSGAFSEVSSHTTLSLIQYCKMVFKGVHMETGQAVALKHQMWSRELRAMQDLSHPNIVRLLDAFPQGDTVVLVMELCAIDLAEALQHTSQRLDEALTKALLLQLLQGIATIHEAGPGVLKVADMGLARMRDAEAERAGGYTHTVATRWYRAPELLLASHSYGPAADMWSVGCILAEMLGLGPFFAGETDLDQLGRVTSVLGSIDVNDWQDATSLPDFGKVCSQRKRMAASAAMQHQYFSMEPLPASQTDMANFVRESCSAKEASKRSRKGL
ncbi:kinase-like protein [Coccomyxa subellipsoidea C-169]|uniref:cyclin-dependent kinase n=1 Tax=Coccomyxa subellipsoidea (strain C-169) TaxID=574566 RepID=I0YTH8_COCSC|nr:kinase-like protein [Coccomyxa subellipsoidea C-169]EIE21697.1 kinase-like protein [Coccomyxa subellipsoidea C-169]|eukprot:XP_005646241.1 kinase-like protein [Coccomyxa subellipsoidea C-169]